MKWLMSADSNNEVNIIIHWPAVIKYRGDDELLFVADAHAWRSDDDLSRYAYDDSDYLIDSLGSVFRFVREEHQPVVVLKKSDCHVELEEFTKLIREHLFYTSQCCIAKIDLKSFSEGISLVRDII